MASEIMLVGTRRTATPSRTETCRWPAARVDEGLLGAWRTRAPGRLGGPDAARIAQLLAGTSIIGEPMWATARAGDAAAAVAVAIRQVRSRGVGSLACDLAMGNLLLLAERGDPGVRPVMGYALRALAGQRAGDRRLLHLAELWSRPRALRKHRQ